MDNLMSGRMHRGTTHELDLLGCVGFLAFMLSTSWTDYYVSF